MDTILLPENPTVSSLPYKSHKPLEEMQTSSNPSVKVGLASEESEFGLFGILSPF